MLNLTAGGVNNVRDGVGRGEQGGRGGEERHLPRHQAHHADCPHPPLHPLRYGGILLLILKMLLNSQVTVIPYAFSSVIKQLQAVMALEAQGQIFVGSNLSGGGTRLV